MLQRLKKIKVEDILCFYLMICPILDILSFLFRNQFNTSISPSTFLRPIIPIGILIYIFFKKEEESSNRLNLKHKKRKMIIIGIVYLIYSIIHILIFKNNITGCSYGGVSKEIQYLINYAFLVINLFIYIYFFIKAEKKTKKRLKVSFVIMAAIYILSIYIAIVTKTSSSTYIESIGYKGWIESGNSISAILVLSLFVILTYLKHKDMKVKIIVGTLAIAIGFYLTMLIGTRVGLYGFFLSVIAYIASEVFCFIIHKKEADKKMFRILIIAVCGVMIAIVLIVIFGSNTLQRRKHILEVSADIIDTQTSVRGHITGDMIRIKDSILDGTIEEGFMSEAQKKSVIELYEYANEKQIQGTDLRKQQSIYNLYLVKNQKSFSMIVFGNGFGTNFREMIMEVELLSILLNFGIVGFILYIGPFIAVLIYAIYKGIKNIKQMNSYYLMYLCGSILVFGLSILSGYTFFNSSNMTVIAVINVLLLSQSMK